MAKFYAQCGPIRQLVDTTTTEQAALAIVDIALQPHLWIYDDRTISDADRRDHLMIEALLHLEPSIRISQRGYDRADAVQIGTPETIEHWHQLIVSVTRLLVSAGLSQRTPMSVGSLGVQPVALPRLPR